MEISGQIVVQMIREIEFLHFGGKDSPCGLIAVAKSEIRCGTIHPLKAILLLLLAFSQVRATDEATVKEQILRIPISSSLEVRLHDGNRLLGRLRNVGDRGFALQLFQTRPDEGSPTRQIQFSEVTSVRYPANAQRDMSEDFKDVVVFAVVGVGVLILLGVAGVAFWWL